MPVVFPPIVYRGHQYVDGGLISNLPVQIAVAKGATEIYALDVGLTTQNLPRATGVLAILNRAIQVMLHQQTLRELEHVLGMPTVTMHHLMLNGFKDLRWGDFSKTSEMIEQGYKQTQAYLDQPGPNVIRRDEASPPPPPGAEEFIG